MHRTTSPSHVREIQILEVGVTHCITPDIRDKPAFLHDADPRARLLRVEQVVRRRENRHTLIAGLPEELGELVGRFRIETGGRLVEQQRARLLRQRRHLVRA